MERELKKAKDRQDVPWTNSTMLPDEVQVVIPILRLY